MADDDLSGFERGSFTHAGTTHELLRCGSGPAVIVIAEMPGITPKVLAFARMLAGIGCSAVLPVLFGEPGRDPVPRMPNPLAALMYAGDSILRACISREFTVWASGKSSPVVDWLRALAVFEHERSGGPGVGAVGMCFTGGYALAMATHPVVLVPVLSQPSLPLPVTSEQRRSIDISPDELGRVKHRCAHDGLQVIGLRFKTDRFVPAERFAFLRDQLGDAFIAVELEDSDANPAATLPAHSVLTEHLIDEPGQPTPEALDLVLDQVGVLVTNVSPAANERLIMTGRSADRARAVAASGRADRGLPGRNSWSCEPNWDGQVHGSGVKAPPSLGSCPQPQGSRA